MSKNDFMKNFFDWWEGEMENIKKSPQFEEFTSIPMNKDFTHRAGNVGNSNTLLTLVSTNDPDGNEITQLTFGGAKKNDKNAFKKGDVFEFVDFYCLNKTIMIKDDAESDENGNVTINIFGYLSCDPYNLHRNLCYPIPIGVKIKTLPDHRRGLLKCPIIGEAY